MSTPSETIYDEEQLHAVEEMSYSVDNAMLECSRRVRKAKNKEMEEQIISEFGNKMSSTVRTTCTILRRHADEVISNKEEIARSRKRKISEEEFTEQVFPTALLEKTISQCWNTCIETEPGKKQKIADFSSLPKQEPRRIMVIDDYDGLMLNCDSVEKSASEPKVYPFILSMERLVSDTWKNQVVPVAFCHYIANVIPKTFAKENEIISKCLEDPTRCVRCGEHCGSSEPQTYYRCGSYVPLIRRRK